MYLLCGNACHPSSGSGDVHCQLEKVNGSLPMFWGWVQYASYKGNKTYHEVVYDVWQFDVSNTPKSGYRKMSGFQEHLGQKALLASGLDCFITCSVNLYLTLPVGCWYTVDTSSSNG